MNPIILNSSLPQRIADLAVRALVDEAELTPKPGLVDRRGNGAHHDLNLSLMLRSAQALRPAFVEMSAVARGARADLHLREELGRIGRDAEVAMMAATAGVNTHRGAIWAIGLLCAAASMDPADWQAAHVALRASHIAELPDQYCLPRRSNGERVRARYGVSGARGEAQLGFPHVIDLALPVLRASRAKGKSETTARLDALVSIMSSLPDTCVLSRGGESALFAVQTLAHAIGDAGGTGSPTGRELLARLEQTMLAHNASPGGAADLLAAALFLDAFELVIGDVQKAASPALAQDLASVE
ncbi:triphosphoribosyl-dephospho-CoA synthase [Rhodoferax sp.]|uniref:triphosphoribosyl-dephospho-CoA synthase n=1 Tax=Rhodoferax sp. TaxID=50421 RepID=UPI002840A6AE|nr:triphosphoribosyl-dephospho-CoA synthase [Rhodoferax sp.]MDR3371511.1 triphosphoribosyl-dephospho-CoA synthase [Rhodoferax sp.]